jgi:NADP-dependent 3-hydroxy acid dehydrogenase YdfG
VLTRAGVKVLSVSRSGPIVADLTRPEDIDRLVQQIGSAPDFLINMAGSFNLARIEDTHPQMFDAMLALNVGAPFRLIRAFLPAMRERRSGHIVTVGSIADHVAFPENAAYSASKYAVRGLHEVLREELRGSPVRATLISPAAVNTSLWDHVEARPGLPPRSGMLSPLAVIDAILFALRQSPGVSIDEIRLSHT